MVKTFKVEDASKHAIDKVVELVRKECTVLHVDELFENSGVAEHTVYSALINAGCTKWGAGQIIKKHYVFSKNLIIIENLHAKDIVVAARPSSTISKNIDFSRCNSIFYLYEESKEEYVNNKFDGGNFIYFEDKVLYLKGKYCGVATKSESEHDYILQSLAYMRRKKIKNSF